VQDRIDVRPHIDNSCIVFSHILVDNNVFSLYGIMFPRRAVCENETSTQVDDDIVILGPNDHDYNAERLPNHTSRTDMRAIYLTAHFKLRFLSCLCAFSLLQWTCQSKSSRLKDKKTRAHYHAS